MKLKHNKKRNTAFLYETLIKELTKAVVSKDIKRKEVLVSIIKEHFSKGTVLNVELDLYKTLKDTNQLDVYTAERLITEVKKQYSDLDKEDIFEKQSVLIESINKAIGKKAFSNFVPNYKTLASISQIFSDMLTAKEKVLLERKLIGRLVSKPKGPNAEKEMEHIDNLVFKKVIENFNKKYTGQLLNEQQELLNKYILSFNNSGLEFKVYLNEELIRIKENLTNLREGGEIKQDKDMLKKLTEIEDVVGRFQTKKINTNMIEKVMSIQNLIAECND
jgi:hypothetical protein